MEYKDYYKTLGVDRKATPEEITRAYRKLARTYHPDVNKDPKAEERFKEVSEAFEVLKDKEKRAEYDQIGKGYTAGQSFRPPPEWERSYSFEDREADPGAFSDFFETLFRRTGNAGFGPGMRGGRGARPQPMDQHARIDLDLADAFTGPTRDISLRMPKVDDNGNITFEQTNLRVKIPTGITPGQQIRLAGKGQDSTIYLEVAFKPHPVFRLEGRDIHLDLPITPWEAALGGKVKMPTPGGPVDITIPKSARSGQKLRLKGRGIPAASPGDLYATLQIVVPPVKTDEGREFYEKMARDMPFDPRRKLGV